MILSRPLLLAAAASALLLAACGDDAGGSGGGAGSGGSGSGTGTGTGTGGHDDEDVDAEACEHLAEGPFAQHTATTSSEDAADVSAPHTGHVITLIDVDGGLGGLVALPVSEAGEVVFFLDVDVPFSIRTSGGADVPLEESCDPAACSSACATIARRHAADLGVGTAYLEIGPTSEATVTLVHEALGAHADE